MRLKFKSEQPVKPRQLEENKYKAKLQFFNSTVEEILYVHPTLSDEHYIKLVPCPYQKFERIDFYVKLDNKYYIKYVFKDNKLLKYNKTGELVATISEFTIRLYK